MQRFVVVLLVLSTACSSVVQDKQPVIQRCHSEQEKAFFEKAFAHQTPIPLKDIQDGVTKTKRYCAKHHNPSVCAQSCVDHTYSKAASFDDIAAFRPNASTLYPGALVRSKGVALGHLNELPIDRAGGTISLIGPILKGDPSTIVNAINRSEVEKAHHTLLSRWQGYQAPAKTHFAFKAHHSIEAALFELGVDVRWLSGSAKASFLDRKQAAKNVVIVSLTQEFYTLVFTPNRADCVHPFVGLNTDPKQLIDTLATHEALYVDGVTYGRRLLFKMETNTTLEELSATMQVDFATGSLKAKVFQNLVESSTNIEALALGGSRGVTGLNGQDALKALGEALKRSAFDPRNNPGFPISYTLRRVTDGSLHVVHSSTEYMVPICKSLPAPIKAHVMLDLRIFDHDTFGPDFGRFWPEAFQDLNPGEEHTFRFSSCVDNEVEGRVFVSVKNEEGRLLHLGSKFELYEGTRCGDKLRKTRDFSEQTSVGMGKQTPVVNARLTGPDSDYMECTITLESQPI